MIDPGASRRLARQIVRADDLGAFVLDRRPSLGPDDFAGLKGEVDAGLQEPHGARVTQHVRGDLLVGQRRTGGGGGGDVAVYDPSDGVLTTILSSPPKFAASSE